MQAVGTWYLYSYFLNRKKFLAYGILIFNQHQEKYGIIFSKSLLPVVTEIGQRALVLAETINNNKNTWHLLGIPLFRSFFAFQVTIVNYSGLTIGCLIFSHAELSTGRWLQGLLIPQLKDVRFLQLASL